VDEHHVDGSRRGHRRLPRADLGTGISSDARGFELPGSQDGPPSGVIAVRPRRVGHDSR
jgi:hypothetical protein